MVRQQKTFPLVADDEIIVGPIPQMNLYEESDLISNIKGPYQDKDFGDSATLEYTKPKSHQASQQREEDLLPPLFEATPSHYSRKERLHQLVQPPHSERKTQGQLARELAREDIKRKRSARYLQDDRPTPAKVIKQVSATPVVEDRPARLNRLAKKLHQSDYILADIPVVYSLNKEDRVQDITTGKKNSYDFLKKSQVYNYPERKVQKERQLAQELNLTHIEEGKNG